MARSRAYPRIDIRGDIVGGERHHIVSEKLVGHADDDEHYVYAIAL